MDVRTPRGDQNGQRLGTSRSGRPILRLEGSATDRLVDAVGLLTVTAGFVVLVPTWNSLPDRIPVHFGFTGEPDRWGAKWLLIMLPVIAVVLYVGLGFLRRFPHAFNYLVPITETNASRQYRIALSVITWLRLEVVVVFTGLTALAVAAGLGKVDRINPWYVLAGAAVILLTALAHVRWHLQAR